MHSTIYNVQFAKNPQDVPKHKDFGKVHYQNKTQIERGNGFQMRSGLYVQFIRAKKGSPSNFYVQPMVQSQGLAKCWKPWHPDG